jgi:hypothetical protein
LLKALESQPDSFKKHSFVFIPISSKAFTTFLTDKFELIMSDLEHQDLFPVDSVGDAGNTLTVEDISNITQQDLPASAEAADSGGPTVEILTDTDESDAQHEDVVSDNESDGNDGPYMVDDGESSHNFDNQPEPGDSRNLVDFLVEGLQYLGSISEKLNRFAPGEYTMDVRHLSHISRDSSDALGEIVLIMREMIHHARHIVGQNVGQNGDSPNSPLSLSDDSGPRSPTRAPPPIPEHAAQGQPGPDHTQPQPFASAEDGGNLSDNTTQSVHGASSEAATFQPKPEYGSSRFIDIMNSVLVAIFLTLIIWAMFNSLASYFMTPSTNNFSRPTWYPTMSFRSSKTWNAAPYDNQTPMQQARGYASMKFAKITETFVDRYSGFFTVQD